MRFKSIVCLFILLTYKAVSAQDFAIAPASVKYKTSFNLRLLFIGDNYREVWATPVAMPLFDIHEEKGGLSIVKLGGGAQTKSLRMKDKDSTEWVLRTIDKDVKKVLPKSVRKTFIARILQDLISTAHPYAPLVVAPLCASLGINAPSPELYFVVEDNDFGEYKKDFANKVCYFERVAPVRSGEEAISSDSLFHNMKQGNNHVVEDSTLLKARLLDMLLADWDRHKDQYKWGFYKQQDKTVYYPIPRDRDQAFFYSDGILLHQARLVSLKFMRNFRKKDEHLIKMNERSALFDKLLLGSMDEAGWQHCIRVVQQTLTDSVLEAAVKKLPPEIYAIDGRLLLQTLIARRNAMMDYGMDYYEFLKNKKSLNKKSREEMLDILLAGHPGKH